MTTPNEERSAADQFASDETGDLGHVREIATYARDIFLRIMLASMDKESTDGSCMHASILLSRLLQSFAGASVTICGGGPPLDGGLLDTSGEWRGHYWIEGTTVSGERFVADITADQFGWPAVVVLGSRDGCERYRAGDTEEIAAHALEVEEECGVVSAQAG